MAIADVLEQYVRPHDYIVDFSCGANDFVPIVKDTCFANGVEVIFNHHNRRAYCDTGCGARYTTGSKQILISTNNSVPLIICALSAGFWSGI